MATARSTLVSPPEAPPEPKATQRPADAGRRGILRHVGSVKVGPGSVVEDVRRARHLRGSIDEPVS